MQELLAAGVGGQEDAADATDRKDEKRGGFYLGGFLGLVLGAGGGVGAGGVSACASRSKAWNAASRWALASATTATTPSRSGVA